MNRAMLGLILAVVQLLPESFAQEPKPTLQLDLSPDKTEVVGGTQFRLTMRVVNLTERVVDCTRVEDDSNLDVTYTYDVRTTDGKSLPNPYDKVVPHSLRARPCKLQPKESFETSVGSLMSGYGMKRPGVYSIQISRPDPAHPGRQLGTSNKVIVIVKAPE